MGIPEDLPIEYTPEELLDLRVRVKRLEESLSHVRRMEVSAEAALRFAEGILETVRQPLLVLSNELRVSSANKAFYDCFKVKAEDTIGRFVFSLGNRQWDIERLRFLLKAVVPANLKVENFEVYHDFPTIGRKVMQLNACKFESDNFGTPSILLTIEDATARKRFEDELMSAAVTDPLTGLQNRRGLLARAERLMERSRSAGRGFDLLFVDVDHLKTINDEFGHAEGDRAIVALAKLLLATFGESDIIARVGGDEFVVAPVGTRDADRIPAMQRMQAALETYNGETRSRFQLSVCAGLARYEPAVDSSIDDILAAGDAAMYEQKKRRNGSCGTTGVQVR